MKKEVLYRMGIIKYIHRIKRNLKHLIIISLQLNYFQSNSSVREMLLKRICQKKRHRIKLTILI